MEKQNVVCCFCGQGLLLDNATLLTVQPNIKEDDAQQIFCHKNCLTERLDASIVLHPDLNDQKI